MAEISTSILIGSPVTVAWEAIADLGSHGAWMSDVESLWFETPSRAGVGTRLRVVTRVGPLRTDDVLEVTEWAEERRIGVAHRGLVRGSGVFELEPAGTDTRLTWREDLAFPAWLGGSATGWLARPVLAWIWRGNLLRLKSQIEASTPPPP